MESMEAQTHLWDYYTSLGKRRGDPVGRQARAEAGGDRRQQQDRKGMDAVAGDGDHRGRDCGGAQHGTIVRQSVSADRFANQRFGGVGKSVERVGGEIVQVEQHSVGGENGIAGVLTDTRGDVLTFGSARCRIEGLPQEELAAEAELRRSGAPELTRRELDVLISLCRPALSDEAFVMPATAKEIAGDKFVTIASADIIQQALNLSLVDEFCISQVPVLFGNGIRCFGEFVGDHVMLDDPLVIQGTRALHLRYPVRR